MKKKHLKSFLFIEGNTVANETVLYAAQMNAGIKPIGVDYLFSYAMTLKEIGREENTNVEMVGENQLCIDAKINGTWQSVAVIEQIEVWEIVKEEENENAIF